MTPLVGLNHETSTKLALDPLSLRSLEQKHVVIFGDFNIAPTASEFDALIRRHYSYVIRENTNISLKTPLGSTITDNMWLSAQVKALATGRSHHSLLDCTSIVSLLDRSGVIRDKLTSMWIPAGWTWGGLVSDHCPIWMEFDLSN